MDERSVSLHKEEHQPLMKRALAYRWTVWGVMVFAFMVVFFHRLAAAVVKDEVTLAFSLSATAFGTMSSMYFYAYMIMQIPVGFLADSLGARITVSAGMFAAGVGSILFGFAPSFFWLLSGRFLVGLGVATVFVCIMKIQSQWFRDGEFATISGTTTLIGNLGGIFSQGPLAFLLTIVSWRSSFIAIGIATLGISFLCYGLIRNRPQDMGFPPINEREILRDGVREESFSIIRGLREVLSVKGVRVATFFYLFNQGGFFALLGTWGTPWLVNVYGMSVAEASSLTVMMILGIMVGGFSVGWISDKTGRRRLLMIAAAIIHTLLWGILLFPWSQRLDVGAIRILFLLLGFTNSAFVLAWSVAKDFTSERFTGLAISVLNAAGFLAIAVVTSVMGMIIDFSSSLSMESAYRSAFLLGLAFSLISTLFAFLIPETQRLKRKA